MPNHVINKLYATAGVLDALSGDDGVVDFRSVLPFPDGLYDPADGGIIMLAEQCAETVFNKPDSDFEPLAMLQRAGRKKWSAADLDDRGLEQFICMVKSKHATGFYHVMDFAREIWGTKWGAYSVKREPGHVSFQTAWSAPEPVFTALSAKFPEEEIRIEYADEGLGSNCAILVLSGGRVVSRIDQGEEFARELWGWDEEGAA